MSSIDIKILKNFAFTVSGILIFIFSAIPFFKNSTIIVWPLFAGLALCILALVKPVYLTSVYRIWIKLGDILGFINSRIILGLFYFFIFAPIAILSKIKNKDRLHVKYMPHAKSYRVIRSKNTSSMERMF